MTEQVAVVVPAHDEAEHVAATVHAVRRSLRHARATGVLGASVIEVVAHRCTDDTEAVARRALHGEPHGRVSRDRTSTSVGQVRARGVETALGRLAHAHGAAEPARTWVLSTDADTLVPVAWVADALSLAHAAEAVAVVGLAPLSGWLGSESARTAYDRVLAAKMRHGSEHHQHDHVYGANLAVRADAYLDVGGFPDVPVGEDQALVDALEAAGHRLLRTRALRVLTSPRLDGRAVGGLATHLARLDAAAPFAG